MSVADGANDAGDAGGGGAVPYFRAYLSAGLSPFPAIKKRPPPAFEWRIYSHQQARPQEVEAWDGYNIALAGGYGGAGAFDIDHFQFWTWLRQQPPLVEKLLSRTWVYRTGSGRGVHLWLRSDKPFGCSNVTLPDGAKLGEIKGDGGYVIVPPSIHETGGRYQTIWGRPDQILKVPDALKVWGHLTASYSRFLGLTEEPGAVAQSVGHVEHPYGSRILPASSDEPWRPKLATLPSRARRALVEPAIAGDGEWAQYPSNSEIQHMIVAAMLRAEWTIDECEQAFADAPFGEYIYRNSDRQGTFGRASLDYCWAKADADYHREKVAAGQAIGPGWKIVAAKRRDLDDPEYELIFQLDDGRREVARIKVGDMTVDKRFAGAVAKSTNWVPELQKAHMGNGIMDLFRAICDMAGREQVADEATTAGFLRTVVRQVLAETANHWSPESEGLGWRENGMIFIRAGLLITRVQGSYHAARLGDIWEVVERMGGTRFGVKGEEGNERVWMLSESALKGY